MLKEKDEFNRAWINEHAKKILATYTSGITVRQLHYRLVSIGMTNDMNHYKRVVTAMVESRWDGVVDMESFIDRERSVSGRTEATIKPLAEQIETAQYSIRAWMRAYYLEAWSNQDYFIEVWIEKKALQGVFEQPCRLKSVALCPCKGYPSLTFLHEAKKRYEEVLQRGKKIVILYFGDYDPSGEDIPRSIQENLSRMGADVEVKRLALTPDQIKELSLPGVPPKVTDTRTRNWDGAEVVELDAVEPNTLSKMCEDSIAEYFDEDKHEELLAQERTEREQYREALKKFVQELSDEE